MPHCRSWAVFLFLSPLLAGCGRGNSEEGVPVSGSVSQAGAGLPDVLVVFTPETAGNSKGALTDASGKFQLQLLPGRYKVLLSKKVTAQGTLPGPDEDRSDLEASGLLRETIPSQYSSPIDSRLSAEIPPAGTQLEPFVLE
jgi:hypothetical protein